MRRRNRAILVAAIILQVGGGCSSSTTAQRAAVMLRVNTNLGVPGGVDRVVLSVYENGTSPDNRSFYHEYPLDPSGSFELPLTFALIPGKEENPTVDIVVRATKNDTDVVRPWESTFVLPSNWRTILDNVDFNRASGEGTERTLSLSSSPSPAREVPVTPRVALLGFTIDGLCTAQLGAPDCDADQNCEAGKCVPKKRQFATLPLALESDRPRPALAHDAGAASCFDVDRCFDGATDMVETGEACTFSTAAADLVSNVALELPGKGVGFCDVDRCLLPLDEGVHYDRTSPATVTLHAETCALLQDATAHAVVAAAPGCPARTSATSICAEQSSSADGGITDGGGGRGFDGGGGTGGSGAGAGGVGQAGSGTGGSGTGGSGTGAAGSGGSSGCTSNAGCSKPKAICDSARGLCVECSMATDCGSGEWTCNAGTCECPGPNTACGQACVSMDTDPANCGACDHNCLGGECKLSQCQPVALVPASLNQISGLAVGPSAIYWSSSTNSVGGTWFVSSTPAVKGGPVTSLASGLLHAGGVALGPDGDRVFYTNMFDLYEVPTSGGLSNPTPLNECEDRLLHGVASDGSIVACANTFDNFVQIWSLDHGDAATGVRLLSGTPFVDSVSGAIAVRAGNVYWSTNQSVIMTPTSSSSNGAAILQDVSAVDLATTASALYWTDDEPHGSNAPGVWMSGLDGKAPTYLASSDTPDSLAVDSSGVYWTTVGDQATVLRTDLSGGAVTTLATNQANPTAIAVNANAVYWIDNGTREVMMVAK